MWDPTVETGDIGSFRWGGAFHDRHGLLQGLVGDQPLEDPGLDRFPRCTAGTRPVTLRRVGASLAAGLGQLGHILLGLSVRQCPEPTHAHSSVLLAATSGQVTLIPPVTRGECPRHASKCWRGDSNPGRTQLATGEWSKLRN